MDYSAYAYMHNRSIPRVQTVGAALNTVVFLYGSLVYYELPTINVGVVFLFVIEAIYVEFGAELVKYL